MKKFITILIIILVLVFAAIIGVYMFPKIVGTEDLIVNEISLSEVKDGSYTGICETKLITAQVTVHVYDHNIYKIDLIKHDNGLGKKAEKIIDDVKMYNSVKVDTISGATQSSLVILKSIENAISSSREENLNLDEYVLVTLVGTIDGNSFEALLNEEAIPFRYQDIEKKLSEIKVNDGDEIYIKYYTNNEQQNIVTGIIKK